MSSKRETKSATIKALVMEERRLLQSNGKKSVRAVSKQCKTRKNHEANEVETAKSPGFPTSSNIANQVSETENSHPVDVIFPIIAKNKFNKFKKSFTSINKCRVAGKLERCLCKMNENEASDFHFLRLHFVRLTIVDALINRKWNCLLRLVIKLGRNYMDPVFRMFIRNLCQILKHYHPSIRGTMVAEQLDLILEKHEAIRKKRSNNANIV